ncbi:MAG: hypothetical protein B6242_07885 [Anaerolineaceae bacterium 4572_78]|nr:MAG: hypothetical protein B6242_07885 [Anaerolineaceae bacterium 4572_78]
MKQSKAYSNYQITTQIYESDTSLVYQAEHQQNKQLVILKMLKDIYPSHEQIARFKHEYETMLKFDSAGIVKVYRMELVEQHWMMILEDFGGESLAKLMKTSPEVQSFQKGNLADFLKLAITIAKILGEIHQQHVIHKDINPANIVYNLNTRQIKIIDFGISTVLSQETPTFLNPNVLEGTLYYISPEQTGRMNRTIDYRTDFYSLGVTFYELLTGQPPFISDNPMTLVHAHIAKEPVSIQGLGVRNQGLGEDCEAHGKKCRRPLSVSLWFEI